MAGLLCLRKGTMLLWMVLLLFGELLASMKVVSETQFLTAPFADSQGVSAWSLREVCAHWQAVGSWYRVETFYSGS